MNYYHFHIGDWQTHTRHLSLLDEAIYRRMIDQYYLRERPYPRDPAEVARLIGVPKMVDRVTAILVEFFDKKRQGYVHVRCERELRKMHAKSDVARDSAKKRWENNRVDDANALLERALPTQCEANAPNNQYPITNKELQRPHIKAVDNSGNGAPKWWQSDASILSKGKELGVEARPGESMTEFKDRLFVRLKG